MSMFCSSIHIKAKQSKNKMNVKKNTNMSETVKLNNVKPDGVDTISFIFVVDNTANIKI